MSRATGVFRHSRLGRRELIVYRFFFEPGVAGWPESGCRGCSFVADQVAPLAHLNARDTTLVFVSHAPQLDIERWNEAMGSTWSDLDITALGRQEKWEDSPEGYPQTPSYAWWTCTTSTRRPAECVTSASSLRRRSAPRPVP